MTWFYHNFFKLQQKSGLDHNVWISPTLFTKTVSGHHSLVPQVRFIRGKWNINPITASSPIQPQDAVVFILRIAIVLTPWICCWFYSYTTQSNCQHVEFIRTSFQCIHKEGRTAAYTMNGKTNTRTGHGDQLNRLHDMTERTVTMHHTARLYFFPDLNTQFMVTLEILLVHRLQETKELYIMEPQLKNNVYCLWKRLSRFMKELKKKIHSPKKKEQMIIINL